MKKFVGTYLMTAVAIALAGYTYWEYQHAREDLDEAKGERAAFSFKRENIDEIQLTLRGEVSILKREGDIWKVTKPVQDLADSSAVEGYLFAALTQHLKVFLSPEEAKNIDWAKYGLETPGSIMTFSSRGKAESIAVSTKSTFDGNFYVKKDNQILLGDRNLSQLSERPISSLRSRKLWRADDATILKVTVEGDEPGQKFSFTKTGLKWQMDPNSDFTLDESKFEAWVNKVEDLLPSDFVQEGIDDQALHNGLLVKPSQIITFDYRQKDGTTGNWVLTLGQDKDQEVFLYTNQRPTLYKTSKASVQALRVSKTYFRDLKMAFHFEVEQARILDIHSQKENLRFMKKDSSWQLKGPAGMTVNSEKLVQLFTNLRSLEAEETVTGVGKGFKSIPQVMILGETGKLVWTLAWGDEFKAKQPWDSGKTLRYVRTSQGPEVYGVEKAKLDQLIDPGLVTPAPKVEKAKAK